MINEASASVSPRRPGRSPVPSGFQWVHTCRGAVVACDTTVVIQVPRWAVGPFEHACPVYLWFVVGSSYKCVVPPISEVEFHGDVRCYVIWYRRKGHNQSGRHRYGFCYQPHVVGGFTFKAGCGFRMGNPQPLQDCLLDRNDALDAHVQVLHHRRNYLRSIACRASRLCGELQQSHVVERYLGPICPPT